MQLVEALRRSAAQLPDGPKLNGIGRASFGTSRLHAALQPVIAQGTFLGGSRHRVDVDNAEWTGRNAVPAAVARVGLNHHGVKLSPRDGTGGAHLKASGVHAVLTDVTHEQPAAVLPGFGELLDEFDVAPVDAIELAGV